MVNKTPQEKIFELPINELQPSQLYISEVKLQQVQSWLNPNDKSNFDPIPIKLFKGKHMMTDGHTRATAAALAGWKTVPVTWDEDSLSMQAYAECVRWCDEAGINSALDLTGRIISSDDYAILWDRRCDDLHTRLELL